MVSERRKGKGSKKKKKRVGLSIREEDRLRHKLRAILPSEPWIDACFPSFVDLTADGEEIVYRFHDERAFPPGGDDTRMRECPRCCRLQSPTYFEGRLCADCRRPRDHRKHGASPSAMAIIAIRDRKVRPETVDLPSQHRADLKKEISFFHQTGVLPSEDNV